MKPLILTLTVLAWLASSAPDADAPPYGLPVGPWPSPPGPGADAPPDVARDVLAGRVLDAASGRPIEAARVTVDGTGLGAITNAAGRWSLTLDGAWVGRSLTVRVQRVGYATATRVVVVAEGTTALDVTLPPEAQRIEQIAVAAEARRDGRVARERLAGLPMPAPPSHDEGWRRRGGDWNTESYDHIAENPFLAAGANPLSTFSIDVDRASYANVRRFLRDGRRPPVDAVRIEELVNYFPYGDPAPRGDLPFSVTTEVAAAPWQPLHRLVRIGLKGIEVDLESMPANNLVFLLDVSGSMRSPDKLPLLKTAFGLLVDRLRPRDRVAIVVYAGAAGLVLPPTAGDRKDLIRDAIERLEAGGSTAGGAGIRLAYDVAARNHLSEGNNRVILATDGDFNIGASSDAEMVRLIEEKREQGTFLTVLGFGTGNLKDSKMEKLADHGNGNFHYIDSELEARKVLVSEMGGTLLTIAKDVKIQVEFNPARVAAYRLIGYENRVMAAEDFHDDRRDAGELGAGHSVTALYEVIPVGVESPVVVREVGALRYQGSEPASARGDSPELLFVKLRYKKPSGLRSELLTHPVRDRETAASVDLRFAAAVAAWGMLLRDSEHGGDFTLADVERLASGAIGGDPGGYRTEFVELVRTTRALELLADDGNGREDQQPVVETQWPAGDATAPDPRWSDHGLAELRPGGPTKGQQREALSGPCHPNPQPRTMPRAASATAMPWSVVRSTRGAC
ncbi:MAG TPA: von Willebrand factor type A domain-containing protein [Longimicrobiales bacterium]|nr:von Willebrand factor type A domain-containing protein [Longimicrobiales bacterium]